MLVITGNEHGTICAEQVRQREVLEGEGRGRARNLSEGRIADRKDRKTAEPGKDNRLL